MIWVTQSPYWDQHDGFIGRLTMVSIIGILTKKH